MEGLRDAWPDGLEGGAVASGWLAGCGRLPQLPPPPAAKEAET